MLVASKIYDGKSKALKIAKTIGAQAMFPVFFQRKQGCTLLSARIFTGVTTYF